MKPSGNPMLRVLHVAAAREDGGGIQSTLRWHHSRDRDFGLESSFVSVFDRRSTWSGDCHTLGARAWTLVGSLSGDFAGLIGARVPAVAVYHDGWGLRWFAKSDAAMCRVVYLHTERLHVDGLVRQFMPWVDGFICVSHALAERVARVAPAFPPARICVPPFFVDPPPIDLPKRPANGHPFRIGYAGRVERGHKRLDRLPALLKSLDAAGLVFEFEVMGEGAYLPRLRREIAGDRRVRFLGWRSGADYWRTMAGWDALVLLSDFEGFSRVTMEAMSCGVAPVHPDFSTAAGELLGPVAHHGLYRTGDMASAAERLAALARLPSAARCQLAEAARRHLENNTPANYGRTVASFLGELSGMPRLSASPHLPAYERWLPLGAYCRLFRGRF